jgi:hypothetical protein
MAVRREMWLAVTVLEYGYACLYDASEDEDGEESA